GQRIPENSLTRDTFLPESTPAPFSRIVLVTHRLVRNVPPSRFFPSPDTIFRNDFSVLSYKTPEILPGLLRLMVGDHEMTETPGRKLGKCTEGECFVE
ncbi:hypothetical protein CEXT_498901, partial [Caerostris extrusa]